MPITVQIPSALRRHTDGVGSITCAASNLSELFSVLDEKFPELKPHLRDDNGTNPPLPEHLRERRRHPLSRRTRIRVSGRRRGSTGSVNRRGISITADNCPTRSFCFYPPDSAVLTRNRGPAVA